MKLLMNKYLFKAFALGGLILFSMSSCQEEDGNAIEYTPGNALMISGSGSAYVGDSESYYLNNNLKDADYNWSIESGATITENQRNDAYVMVDFTMPGAFNLSVVKGDASGIMPIEINSRDISFSSDSLDYTETISNDTLTIPLSIGGGLNGEVTIDYSISGSIESSQYEVVAGYESPLTLNSDDNAELKLVIYSDGEVDSNEDLILSINTVDPVMADEYIESDTLQTTVYSFMDDSKVAWIDTTDTSINEVGLYTFDVKLTNPAAEDIVIGYSVSAAMGVEDATPTDVKGTLLFTKGTSQKVIALSVAESAFTANQQVTITLNSVSSTDAEAGLDDDSTSKSISISSE